MSEREMDFVDECYADKDLSLLKKLTLVIPTYNRNYYLSRCLWYHAHFPFGEIIVADSSPEEKKIVNRETVAKIRSLFGANIRYLEYEPETDKYGGDIYRKWADAIQHVETEYSQICADKEFVLPIAQVIMVDFLMHNLSYDIADGQFYTIRQNILNKATTTMWRGLQKSSDNIDPIIRLKLANREDVHPLMSIHRSNIQKKVYSDYLSSNLKTLAVGEIFLELCDIVQSQYHHDFKVPYLFRDVTEGYVNNRPNPNNSSFVRYPQGKDLSTEISKDDREILIDCIYSILPEYNDISCEEFSKLVIDYVDVRWGIKNSIKSSNIYQLLRRIWWHTPTKLKYCCTYVYQLILCLNSKRIDITKNTKNADVKVILNIINNSEIDKYNDNVINYLQR